MSPKQRTDKLPKYVYKRRGCYVLGTYDSATGKVKYKRLCSDQCTLAEIWKAYEEVTQEKPRQTFRWLSNQYQASLEFAEKARRTQQDYRDAHRIICQTKTTNGALVGDQPLAGWTPGVVKQYLDARGKTAPVRANREKSYMSVVFSWGYERDIVKSNPAKGVRKITEHHRTRYVTDAEYYAVLRLAAESGSPYMWALMELAYLLRARTAEVLDLTDDSITPDGILLIRRKGSKDSINAWTPRLRAAIDYLMQNKRSRFRPHLFQSTSYDRAAGETIKTAWGRLMKKWEAQGGERFTLQDLKAKGVTDTKEKKLDASGHRTERMLQIYDRLPTKVRPTR